MKIDCNGGLLWAKIFGGPDEARGYSVKPNPDGSYIIAGSTKRFGIGDNDVYLIKTGERGDSLWTKSYGRLNDEQAWSVYPTTDEGFAVIGTTTGFGEGQEDIYFIKTDAFGYTGCTKKTIDTKVVTVDIQFLSTYTVVGLDGLIENEVPTLTNNPGDIESTLFLTADIHSQDHFAYFIFFPNPATDKIHLEFNLQRQETISLGLFNSLGRVVVEIPPQYYPSGKKKLVIQSKSLVNGIYFIVVAAGNKKKFQTIIFHQY